MKHVAAYMLCVLGGNASPSSADVKKVLAAGGVEADAAALDKVGSRRESIQAELGEWQAEAVAKLQIPTSLTYAPSWVHAKYATVSPDKHVSGQVVSSLSGKDVSELVASGLNKMANVPSGGGLTPRFSRLGLRGP